MADPASNAVAELASTLQSASINTHPSPQHDLNPSTAASTRQPVRIQPQRIPSAVQAAHSAEDEIPLSALRPVPRSPDFPARRGAQHTGMPPLPDLRFEQSYLRSIEGAGSRAAVAWITVRDQVVLPLLQGTLWTLVLAGWRHWNRASQMSGASVGARLRRWWWGVNDWKLPGENKKGAFGVRRA